MSLENQPENLTTAKQIDLCDLAVEDLNRIELMLQENAELATKKDNSHRLLIHWAALKGREKVIQILLSMPGQVVDPVDDTNATPLILAVLGGHLETVKLLLSHGAAIDHQNWQGHSPLQYACSKGFADIVALLLEMKANVNIKDNRSDTSLHRLVSLGRLELLETLLKNDPKPKVDVQNSEGNTPLHIACEDGEVGCALTLIANGASVEIENKDKLTPLDVCKPNIRRQILDKIKKE